jgi:hypothetical protein
MPFAIVMLLDWFSKVVLPWKPLLPGLDQLIPMAPDWKWPLSMRV